jgi:hypothetical protein
MAVAVNSVSTATAATNAAVRSDTNSPTIGTTVKVNANGTPLVDVLEIQWQRYGMVLRYVAVIWPLSRGEGDSSKEKDKKENKENSKENL